LTFDEKINGLSAADITLSGVAGVTKGTLTGGPRYVLPISGFTEGGTLTVTVAKSGFTINGSPKTVPIYALNWNSSVDVYVVGVSNSKATLWKNGVKTFLSNSQSYAKSVYVSGSDVYVAGYVGSGISDYKATLWKNGTAQTLYSSASQATSVFVSGSDVYVAGITGTAPRRAVYWKNGSQTTLTLPTLSSGTTYSTEANSIYVSGSDVYVAGTSINNTTSRYATYWKNGTPQPFSSSGSEANSIFVSGSTFYMALTVSTKATIYSSSTNSSTQLSSQQSWADSVFVSGSNVYVSGKVQGSGATLWKNGNSQTLNTAGSNGYSVFVYGSDVYVAGSSDGATLWVNGTEKILDEAGIAYSVFVKARQ